MRSVGDGTHPAIVALVERDGDVLWHEAFGELTPGGPALTADAIFPLASVSKPITATALLALVDDGRVGLTRPVREYIPEFAHDAVCVHHLLTHTTGIDGDAIVPYIEGKFGTHEIPPKEKTAHTWVHGWTTLGLDTPLATQPGTEMSYCTYNTDLAGEIVRRVTGKRFSDHCAERIFEPLGMNDTYWVVPDEVSRRVVRGRPERLPANLVGLDGREFQRRPLPSGGAFSTATDMAAFTQMFLDGGRGVLSPHLVKEATTNQIPGVPGSLADERHDEASWSYGWGVAGDAKWRLFPTVPRGAFGHGGASGVYVWGDPSARLVGAFFGLVARYPTETTMDSDVDLFVNAVYAALDH